jgi:Mg2+ and Co2+ transporter CorA
MANPQVFTLIAQEDNRNSATIAERQTFISERAAEDSRVMRIIGILTALFLPATFVTVRISHDSIDVCIVG